MTSPVVFLNISVMHEAFSTKFWNSAKLEKFIYISLFNNFNLYFLIMQ